MTSEKTDQATAETPLRLWPGVLIAALQCLTFVVAAVLPGGFIYGLLGGFAGGLLILLWWLFLSRAPWLERVGAVVLMVAGVLAVRRVVDPSIATAGMGRMLYILSVPVVSLALVAWAAASRRLATGPRRASMVATILLACGLFAVVRTSGVSGDGGSDLHWRWSETPEQRLLAQAADEPLAAPAPAATASETPVTAPPAAEPAAPAKAAKEPTPSKGPAEPKTGTSVPVADTSALAVAPNAGADWPGFRGPGRDSVIRGAALETDWAKSPPVELWRRPIGPGWSSFAVHDDLLYTQEQRGDDETVSCYELKDGKPVWRHRDKARFWESNAGTGPRGTPSLSNGRVYTFGATGIVNALDAGTGAVVWSRDAASDTGAKLPGWGFTSSPLVVDDAVIVAASGRLAAYDLATGHPRWTRKTEGGSYSSPHLATISDVTQVLLMNGGGLTSVAPADGAVLWQYKWEGAAILQPGRTPDGDLLVTTADMMGGVGTRRLAVAHGPEGWKVDERWTSVGLKPYYNDFVIHAGHAFGFDGSILACIDLADGKRKWKGGRYGHGQLMLLPDQDLLFVLSEEGELALVRAAPDQFTELARFPAIQGKTWNHPVLVGDILLARNSEEMAAFRLASR